FDDFHDIFPGSGIATNYRDAERNLADVQRVGNSVLNASLAEIASNINFRGTGVPVVVFNSLSWQRNELMDTEVVLPAPADGVTLLDPAGKMVPAQTLSVDRAKRRVRLLFQANVPSMGSATYYAVPGKKPSASPAPIKASGDTLENEFVRVKVDPKTGCMTSLFDKRTSIESLAPSESDSGGQKDTICGNLLQAFRDKPKQWDAWNIDADFEKEHWDLAHADEVKLV